MGWPLSGALLAVLAVMAITAGNRPTAFLIAGAGGALAIAVGAFISATRHGRNARSEMIVAAGSFSVAIVLFFALISTRPPEYFNMVTADTQQRQFYPWWYALTSAGLFGLLFGIGVSWRSNKPRLLTALGCAAAALLAAISIFFAAYILGSLGGAAFRRMSLQSAGFMLGAGLGGFVGSLLPAALVEWLLRPAR